MARHEFAGHIGAERAPHTSHFEAMREAIVYEDTAWQREDLRLVLHTAEGRGEDEAVVVAQKLCAALARGSVVLFFAEAFI